MHSNVEKRKRKQEGPQQCPYGAFESTRCAGGGGKNGQGRSLCSYRRPPQSPCHKRRRKALDGSLFTVVLPFNNNEPTLLDRNGDDRQQRRCYMQLEESCQLMTSKTMIMPGICDNKSKRDGGISSNCSIRGNVGSGLINSSRYFKFFDDEEEEEDIDLLLQLQTGCPGRDNISTCGSSWSSSSTSNNSSFFNSDDLDMNESFVVADDGQDNTNKTDNTNWNALYDRLNNGFRDLGFCVGED